MRSIYNEYKKYGSGAIPKPDLRSFKSYTKDEKDLLYKVYDAFGQYSAWALSELSHETAPWKNAPLNSIISKDSMKRYFKTQVDQ